MCYVDNRWKKHFQEFSSCYDHRSMHAHTHGPEMESWGKDGRGIWGVFVSSLTSFASDRNVNMIVLILLIWHGSIGRVLFLCVRFYLWSVWLTGRLLFMELPLNKYDVGFQKESSCWCRIRVRIRLHGICAVHTVMNKSELSSMAWETYCVGLGSIMVLWFTIVFRNT